MFRLTGCCWSYFLPSAAIKRSAIVIFVLYHKLPKKSSGYLFPFSCFSDNQIFNFLFDGSFRKIRPIRRNDVGFWADFSLNNLVGFTWIFQRIIHWKILLKNFTTRRCSQYTPQVFQPQAIPMDKLSRFSRLNRSIIILANSFCANFSRSFLAFARMLLIGYLCLIMQRHNRKSWRFAIQSCFWNVPCCSIQLSRFCVGGQIMPSSINRFSRGFFHLF